MSDSYDRECKRCKLFAMAEADASMVCKYIEEIKPQDRAEESIYNNRLSVCETCDKQLMGTCRVCGCYVMLRALGKYNRCPNKKW